VSIYYDICLTAIETPVSACICLHSTAICPLAEHISHVCVSHVFFASLVEVSAGELLSKKVIRFNCFHGSSVHFLWSLYITHTNNLPAVIIYFSQSLQKRWIEVSLYCAG
jgi:hypothetical protein